MSTRRKGNPLPLSQRPAASPPDKCKRAASLIRIRKKNKRNGKKRQPQPFGVQTRKKSGKKKHSSLKVLFLEGGGGCTWSGKGNCLKIKRQKRGDTNYRKRAEYMDASERKYRRGLKAPSAKNCKANLSKPRSKFHRIWGQKEA